MKIGYYVKDHGGGVEDTIYFSDTDVDLTPHLPSEAQVACEYAWGNNDGWEWLRTGVVLTLVVDGKEVGDFEITVDSIPSFYAQKKS